jgi:hypothetical protein
MGFANTITASSKPRIIPIIIVDILQGIHFQILEGRLEASAFFI